jgi:hypothetical protein
MQRHLVVLLLLGAVAGPKLFAAPLTEAHVTKIINEVKVVDPHAGDRGAKLDDIIHGDLALTTGIKSRSELIFQDNTLTRLGPESYFSFVAGTRDMTLQRGTLLLQVPKGHGGANIHTAAVTAAITGTTIMIEHLPQKSLKVLVLEGSLRLSNGRFGDSLLLTPGKMVIMPPNAKRIPDPVTVDLKKIMGTSDLVNMDKGGGKKKGKPLPSIALIEQEAQKQAEAKNDHRLVDTNLVIMGKGTNVLLASNTLLDNLSQRADVATGSSGVLPSSTPASGPTPVSTPGGGGPSSTPPIPSSTPPPNDIGPIASVKVTGDGKKTEVRYGDKGHPITSALVLNKAQDYSANGGSGSVKIETNDSVTINNKIKVSDSTIGKKKGEISINSNKTNGTAISVNSSGQLLALLAASPGSGGGGKITFNTAGGDININGGTVQSDRGSIEMRNNGANGSITLANATLNASTIKAGALGTNGTLTIGGGTINADTLIKLYASNSNGTVNFVDNVTLSGNSVKNIAGNTVTIFNGKVVTVHGPAPANVFTNNPNYTGFGGNGSTTGTFAGQGATTQPLSNAPGY